MPVSHAFEIIEQFQEGQLTGHELGGQLKVLAPIVLEHLLVLLLDGIVLSYLHQEVRDQFVVYTMD